MTESERKLLLAIARLLVVESTAAGAGFMGPKIPSHVQAVIDAMRNVERDHCD